MDYDTHFKGLAADPGGGAADSDEVEIACPDLRLSGRVVLGQFKRLSDLFNQSKGYIVVRTARPQQADHVLEEMMIRREDITFVGQTESVVKPGAGATTSGMSTFDRPLLAKVARRLVFYTPSGAISANVHMLEEMTLASFLDGREPHFIATTGAHVHSLVDHAVVAEFGLLLLNRAHITAAAEAARAGGAAD